MDGTASTRDPAGRATPATHPVDLRSDTVTKPTRAMRAAIASATVGDEQYGEDPTVNEIEQRIANLLGQDEAIFLPSATMANQIALMLLVEPGDEVVAASYSHIFWFEAGGPALHSRAWRKEIDSDTGVFDPQQLRECVNPRDSVHMAKTAAVVLENTHNGSGGVPWPLGLYSEVTQAAHELGLLVHLDGARIWNAAVATECQPSAYAALADTVTVCLSKGLGCPAGALIGTSRDRAVRARRIKQAFGGSMRQSGLLAAAGLFALENNVDRLAEDHRKARRLEALVSEAGFASNVRDGQTNIVLFDLSNLGVDTEQICTDLTTQGVLISHASRPGHLRALTHLDVSHDDIERAGRVIAETLQRTSKARRSA